MIQIDANDIKLEHSYLVYTAYATQCEKGVFIFTHKGENTANEVFSSKKHAILIWYRLISELTLQSNKFVEESFKTHSITKYLFLFLYVDSDTCIFELSDEELQLFSANII